MHRRIVSGALLLMIGLVTMANPSLTGAVIGAPDTNTILLVSLPIIALGAAVVANALRSIFFSAA